jgi:RNA polymerase sigma-70 factor (ECF subfamily)
LDANRRPQGISDYAAELIRCKARQLLGKAGFTWSDVEDLEQEMILELIQRFPKFDPAKAAHSTFAARIVEHKISKLFRHRRREMRDYRRESCSLDDTIEDAEGETIWRACTINQDEAAIRLGRRTRTREEETQLRIDISLVLAKLPDDLREIAGQLLTKSVAEVARDLGIPRTTLYESVKRLRPFFEDTALRNYL